MDRAMPAPEVVRLIEAKLGRKWLPMQYIGKVAQYSHSVHQAGGQTQITYTHCRTHRGFDDEFLQVLTREVEVTKAQQSKRTIRTVDLFEANSWSDEDYRAIAAEQKRGSGELLDSVENKLVIPDKEDLKKLLSAYMQGKIVEGQLVPGNIKRYRGTKVVKIETKGTIELSDEQAKDIGVDPNTTVTLSRLEWQRVGSAGLEEASGQGEDVWAEVEVHEKGKALNIAEEFTFTFEIQIGTGKFLPMQLSIEEALTPGWYSKVWGNKTIGKQVYKPLLGVEAITDGTILGSKEQDDLISRNIQLEATKAMKELTGVEKGVSGKTTFKYVDSSTVPGSVSELQVIPGSIEEAIDSLTIIYGIIKAHGGDIHEFVRQYTHRDIANMENVLGSQNLSFDDSGNIDPKIAEDVVEGFHSRAFGDYNVGPTLPDRKGSKAAAGKDALKALFPGVPTGKPVERNSLLDKKRPKSAIEPYYDPRGRARARVRGYIQELSISRGLLG